ncbi:sodium:solute symporter family protein [Aquibacillus sp. 3ASR75-11]|uniref:Sodium:solute symporter family protein n=1 Tax=Terrihalobacillus insolitus TaxID=2950438 RepID=A0A9X4AKP1_9BACI|nr:sodium:solute symporter family protein [Terrihalobacillus insolitus]MDC3412004.1 sodium:solute symporter family protein [Terrihalobacillus insolitus]MDC3423311.1 sodium:solute symporter family protein [Terrihalobacillus insolitus]
MGEETNSFVWIIGIVLFGYFVLTTWLGKKGSVHSRSMRGFAIAKGKVKPWIVGVSFGASFASANLFLGVPGWAYTYGASTLWWALGCFGLTWIGLLLFAKTFWKQGQKNGGSLTLPQWLGVRYQSKALQVIVALLVLFNIYYIVGQNVGLATMFETIIGIPYIWGIIIGVGITIVYVSLGGAFAQLISDGIQGIIMSVISVLLFISLLWTIGGGWNVLGNLHTQLSNIDESLVASTSEGGPFYSGFAILSIQWLLFTFALLPHLMNKVLTIEKEEDLRTFTLSSGITLFLLSAFSVFAGMAARLLAPGLESADGAIPAYIVEAFPPIIVALMVTGIISAILSTTDSLYLGLTTSIGNDLYKILVVPFLYKNKNISEKKLDQKVVRVSKISLIVLGVLSLYMSIDRPDSLALLTQFGISAIISGIIAPVSLGYFWKRANRPGAINSVIFGSGCYMILTGTGIVENVFQALFFSSIVGFVVMISVSIVVENVVKEKKAVSA